MGRNSVLFARLPATLAVAVWFGVFGGCKKDPSQEPTAVRSFNRTYVNDALCLECHRETGKSYHSSAHALTSALPSSDSIKGTFEPGKNTMSTTDPNLSFVMTRAGPEFFETAIMTTPIKTFERRQRIDLVFGSGRSGQTFLYWDRDLLYELPVSWWTRTAEWANSPGYPDGTANFDRGISDRCLECHTSSFESLAPPRNHFNPASLSLGISCQKCHGPGSEHLQWARSTQSGSPSGDTGILNPADLPRTRQMDLCSLCHAGVGKALAPPLSYIAGEALGKYLTIVAAKPGQHIDPHGSQALTLVESRCFRESTTLTCISCHDVHQQQRSVKNYIPVCLSCHQMESCGKFPLLGEKIRSQCIDCHMPLETTAKIVMRINGERHQPEVRTHRIGIYPSVPAP